MRRQSQANKKKDPHRFDLSLDRFVKIYIAFGLDLLLQTGRSRDEEEKAADETELKTLLEQLPSHAAERFTQSVRCTFSWLSDSTTLAIIGHKHFLGGGPLMLRIIFIGQVLVTSPTTLSCLDDLRDQPANVIEERLKEVHTTRKSCISKGLQTGVVSWLRKCAGVEAGETKEIYELIAKAMVLFDRELPRLWDEICAGRDAMSVLAEKGDGKLGLPSFRSHCVARLLYMGSGGLHGTSPDSFHVGYFAAPSLYALEKEVSHCDSLLQRLLPSFQRKLVELDSRNVRARLGEMYVEAGAAQTWEHMLCESRKLLDPSLTPGPYRPRGTYKERFEAALETLEKAPRHCCCAIRQLAWNASYLS
jgi:hypothetical protein